MQQSIGVKKGKTVCKWNRFPTFAELESHFLASEYLIKNMIVWIFS